MKSSEIGGQAVLEGVMMRNHGKYAVAVRKPDGGISVQSWETKSIRDKHIFWRLPIIRGVVAFVESLVLGIKTLTYSSDILEEEEEQLEQTGEQKEKTGHGKETVENVLIVLLSIFLAIAFFMLLPFGVSELFRGRIHSQTALAVMEGVLRVLLFLGYVVAISLMEDIKRVYMYHGAEHKAINCVESGLELTVENAQKQSRMHRRCGTSFLLVVMIVSIIFFLFIHIDNLWLRMLYRILLIPVVAGVSFEFILLAGNSENPVVLFLSKPGLWLQKLTTREPDAQMVEVAIASVEAVFDWRAYQEACAKETKRRKRHVRKKEIQKTNAPAAQKESQVKEADNADNAVILPWEGETAQETTKKQEPDRAEDMPEESAAQTVWKGRHDSKKKPEKSSTGVFAAFHRDKKGSRSQKRRELEEREMRYRNRAAQRARMIKEQEEREAAHEKAYQEAKKHQAERLAATQELPKLENTDAAQTDDDILKNLDHFFDEKKED